MTESTPKPSLAFDQPEDRAEDEAKGYAVYDRQLGGYFGGVHSKKSDAEAEAKGSGHLVVVRV